MSARLWLLPALALGPLACGSDQLRQRPCVEEQQAFDIEEVSKLELVHAVEGGADGVVLKADKAGLETGAKWRVGSVQVLVAIPTDDFPSYPKDVSLTMQVWDRADPTQGTPWEVTQKLDTSTLDWMETSTYLDPTYDPFTLEAYYPPVEAKTAWWTFDFSNVIPDTGMTSSEYFVAVKWVEDDTDLPMGSAGHPDLPMVGASDFNLECSKNWTDYNNRQGWVPNTDTDDVCSWPMFKVATQSITMKTTCD
ncbi:MAG: hypothetical protein RL199_2191 [Pseudomonadota bacterium]